MATTSQTTSRLRRFCQNVPLPQLKQGSYLTIRSSSLLQPPPPLQQKLSVLPSKDSAGSTPSSCNIPIHVIIEPSWRDNGHVEFRQYFRTTATSTPIPLVNSDSRTTVQMNVRQETMNDTSKDRNAIVPHVTIDLLVQQQTISTTLSPHQLQEQKSNKNNDTQQYYNNYFHKTISSSLPKTSLTNDGEMDGSSSSKWMEEVEEDDAATTTISYSQSTSYIHTNDSHSGPSVCTTTTTTTPDTNSHDSNQYDTSTYATLTIQVPEKLNVTCELLHHNNNNNGSSSSSNNNDIVDNPSNSNSRPSPQPTSSITIHNKLEGDITLRNTNGDIIVSKLRGHEIHLQTASGSGGGGVIYVSNLLEAQLLTIQCSGDNTTGTNSRIRAKQMHANSIDISMNQRQARDEQQPIINSDTNVIDDKSNNIRIMDQDDDEGSLVDISSMFVSGPNGGAIINVRGNDGNANTIPRKRAVRIKSHHGPIQVGTDQISKPTDINQMTGKPYPIIELGGVNGSCEVTIKNSVQKDISSTSTVPIDNNNIDDEWSSCLVHVDSLAAESVSLVTADTGSIDITLDRKTIADLRLASVPKTMKCRNIHDVGAMLADEDDNAKIVNFLRQVQDSNNTSTDEIQSPVSTNVGQQPISIQTSAFTNRSEHAFENNNVSYVDGWVENKSSEPDSRFERKNQGVGKIRLDGAKTQALKSFTDSSGGSSTDELPSVGINSDTADVLRPLLAVVGTNEIRVETVSWLGAIARRYGLEESGRKLGRTASRKGREFSDSIN